MQPLTAIHVLVQTKTSIPIPKVLDWSDDASNPIGSEYIIMKHAAGIQLQQRWSTMAGDQQVRCINAIYQKVQEMVDIKFPAYGSLYFANTPLDSGLKQILNQRFCIGPHCGAIYWDCNVAKPDITATQSPTRDLVSFRESHFGMNTPLMNNFRA